MALAAMNRRRYLEIAAAADDILSPNSTDDHLELDESDVWSKNDVASPEKVTRTSAAVAVVDRPATRSLPMNIPDWSKILGGEYRQRAVLDDVYEAEEEDDIGNDIKAPHEYLARTRVAPAFSVETLKGRDLRRVRNAILKKTGLED